MNESSLALMRPDFGKKIFSNRNIIAAFLLTQRRRVAVERNALNVCDLSDVYDRLFQYKCHYSIIHCALANENKKEK